MAQDWVTETHPIRKHRVVIIGGSTGSIDVLLDVLPTLPVPLPFALIVVVHRKNTADSALASLLAFKSKIPVREVDDKEPVRSGQVYVAPADYHLLFETDGTFSLDDSEKVHYSRPSIDVTFESAADVYGQYVVGILLSGANADGTEGLKAIQRAGGQVVVQDPATAQVAFMPQQAIQQLSVDQVLGIPALARFISQLNTQ